MGYQRLQVQLSDAEYESVQAAKGKAGVSMRVFLLGLVARYTGERVEAVVDKVIEEKPEKTKVVSSLPSEVVEEARVAQPMPKKESMR